MAIIRPTRDEVSDRFPVLGFAVQTGGAPYFEIMLTTDPELPKDQRSAENFFSTRAYGPLPAERGEAVYLVPAEVLHRFAGHGKLYYGLATFSDSSRHDSHVARVPSAGGPYINLHSFTGRSSRRMQITGRPRPARGGNGHGYSTAPGDDLTWTGDQAQPGAEVIAPARTPAGAPPRPVPPENGNGHTTSAAAYSRAASPSAMTDYDDGFGPMPLALEEDGGIEGPIPDAPPTAAQQAVARAQTQTPEYPQATRFAPAHSGNFRTSTSERSINRIVIHITDGGANINGPISWFQNPQARVSAHYIVGQDGEVVQMVLHKDVAWHASSANGDSIGIEHVANTRGLLPTQAEYCASAALVSWLCDQFGIPKDRDHIVGHNEADPKTSHAACPTGLKNKPVWDWDGFMQLIENQACEDTSTPVETSLGVTESSSQRDQNDAVLGHITQTLGASDVEARGWLELISVSGRYPYIDGYMDAISEVAAIVLAYASQKIGALDDVIAAAIAQAGGDESLGRKMIDGSMNEPTFLLQIGAEVARRQPSVGNRFRELVERYSGTGLAYYFHPSDSSGNTDTADAQTEEIRYALQDGNVNKVARLERNAGVNTLVFDWMGQTRRVLIVDVIDAPPGAPSTSGWVSAARKTTTLASVVSYILLYACGKWAKSYGTEIVYEVDGQRWLAKKAIHNDSSSGGPRNTDHPGMDVYVAAAAMAAGLGRRSRARAFEVTGDSTQAEQSQAVLERVARSMQQKEGTRFNQVHYDSNIVNFGIGSWTQTRIATVLDAYEELAAEQGSSSTLYGYFGGKNGFDDLRSRFRSGAVGVPMTAADKSALEALGGDPSLQDAQVRLLAKEVRQYVDAIAKDNRYPFIDGYMNAVTEVAAHVLAHAVHQHGRVNDLIADVIASHGGDPAFGQEITNGTMDERTFLGEVGEAVARRVKPEYRNGVRKRYQDLITQFTGSGLGYFFDPQPAATASGLGRGERRGSMPPPRANGLKPSGRPLSDQSFTLNWDEVELIAQPTDVSCWAASAAMVVGWKDRISLTPEAIVEIAGRSTATGLDPAQVEQFATEIGLAFEPPQSYSIEGFRRLLEASGPLWVGASLPGLHAIVVTGMYSDGAPDGSDTFVRITDPWDRVAGNPGSPGPYLKTHAQGSRYILRWADFVREFEAAATDFASVNLQILHASETAGRTPNTGRPADYAMAAQAQRKPISGPARSRPISRSSPLSAASPTRKPIRPPRARQLGDPGDIVPDYSQAQSTAQALAMFFEWLSHEMKFRTGIHDARFFPHSAIAKLRLVDGGGNLLGEGSGFYVGPHKIITAGHCLVNDDGSRVQGVEVIPGLHGTDEPFGGASVGITGLHPHPKYNPLKYDPSYDIGVITGAPDAPNGEYFEMEELRMSPNTGIITCGYAAVGVDPTIQHMDVDAIRELHNGTFTYAAQVRQGSSGGPVFYALDAHTIKAVGLNVTTYDAQVNRGLRLTDPLIAWINSIRSI